MFPIIPANTLSAPSGNEEGIFGYGQTSGYDYVSLSNKVSSSGVVASDVTGVGTARSMIAACEYGSDKAIFAYGYDGSNNVSMSNLVSNTGVIASDTTGVGTARRFLAACSYGDDKGIFA